MPEPVYTARTAALLAASRQRADQTEQTARATATTCGWCANEKTLNAPCCGAEPWRTP